MEQTLRVFYRCDKVVTKDTILWTGPSETQLFVLEENPVNFVNQPLLMFSLRNEVYESLKQQPFVQSLCKSADDCTGVENVEVLYDTGLGSLRGYSKMDLVTLSNNRPIITKNDKHGTYAELFITVTIGIEKRQVSHPLS